MRILFTGASSFTGYWFANTLAKAGHEVLATLTQDTSSYEGIRARRLRMLKGKCEFATNVRFGDDKFIDIVQGQAKWDLLCHHGAMITGYRSPEFDVAKALANNTQKLAKVAEAMAGSGCSKVLLTGSFFEIGEGGEDDSPAMTLMGLSKSFSTLSFRHHCSATGLDLGHFVITNPFGPLENDRNRFTSYLMDQWMSGKEVTIKTPDYIRDNIHVRLLAQAYLTASESMLDKEGFFSFRPSGYVETQGKFAERVAVEARKRTHLECTLSFSKQHNYDEPISRRNSDTVASDTKGPSETALWDEFVEYYSAEQQG